MQAILSILKLFLFGLWSFIVIIIGGLFHLIRIKNGMEWAAKYLWAPVVLPLLFARIKVEGSEHIDTNEKYLIIANHNSFIDIPVLFKTMPFYTYFIAKKELRKIPLLGWYIEAYGMIYIDRSDRIKATESIEEAGKLVSNGKRVIIFPEGTKSKDGKIAPFKKGGFHLTSQAKVPILPIKIEGARKVWPNKKPFNLGYGTITVKIGKPILPDEISHMDIPKQATHVRDIICSI